MSANPLFDTLFRAAQQLLSDPSAATSARDSTEGGSLALLIDATKNDFFARESDTKENKKKGTDLLRSFAVVSTIATQSYQYSIRFPGAQSIRDLLVERGLSVDGDLVSWLDPLPLQVDGKNFAKTLYSQTGDLYELHVRQLIVEAARAGKREIVLVQVPSNTPRARYLVIGKEFAMTRGALDATSVISWDNDATGKEGFYASVVTITKQFLELDLFSKLKRASEWGLEGSLMYEASTELFAAFLLGRLSICGIMKAVQRGSLISLKWTNSQQVQLFACIQLIEAESAVMNQKIAQSKLLPF